MRIPQILDRQGLLGRPVGAQPGATATDNEFLIGTNDFITEWIGRKEVEEDETYAYPIALDNNTNVRIGYQYSTNEIRLIIGGSSWNISGGLPRGFGVTYHGMVFADRSGSAYIYIDGELLGTVDISGEVATNCNSDSCEIGGRCPTSVGVFDALQLARLFVLSGAFPTAGEIESIVNERYLNPDVESPTLADRSAYATEKRLDVDFVGMLYGATTVANSGTGPDLTIGGGLNVEDIRTREEGVAKRIPEKTFYTVAGTYSGSTGAHDFGFGSSNPVIIRMITGPFGGPATVAGPGIEAATSGDRVRHRLDGSAQRLQSKASGTQVNMYFDHQQMSLGGDIWVVCSGTVHDYYWNGQHVFTDNTFGGALDLSGNCTVTFDGRCHCCRFAAWQMSSVPTNIVQDIRDCCLDPETDPISLTGKLIDFPIKSDLIGSGDSTVANQGSGGGTLTLTGTRANACAEMFHGSNP